MVSDTLSTFSYFSYQNYRIDREVVVKLTTSFKYCEIDVLLLHPWTIALLSGSRTDHSLDYNLINLI